MAHAISRPGGCMIKRSMARHSNEPDERASYLPGILLTSYIRLFIYSRDAATFTGPPGNLVKAPQT